MDVWPQPPLLNCEKSESFGPEQEQRRCSSCMVTEDQSSDGHWSQRSLSRSLQRAEVLLRSTFNPTLKWLFQSRSQDEEEEEHFVVAHNLVSRSSARLLRLQQALLTVAPQWQLEGGAQMGSPQGHYTALWRLLEQRSLLLFIHEYTRRTRLTTAFISRVSQLLEQQLKRSRLTPNQTPSSWSSFRLEFGPLSQELRVHLNHWSCLFSKVQSDHYLRAALVRHAGLLVESRQTLDLLGLQALVLMERYVSAVLSALAQTELESVPREILEDVLAGTDLYNQAVEEQRGQHSAFQLRTAVLQQAHYSTWDPCLSKVTRHHPSAFSVKELMTILAVRHAEMAARQLHSWASEQSHHACQVHNKHKADRCSDDSPGQVARLSRGISELRAECTWEQLQHTYLTCSPLFSVDHPTLQSSSCQTCSTSAPISIPDLHLDSTVLENRRPVLAKSTSVHQPGQCQTCTSQSGPTQTNGALNPVQSNLEDCKLLPTVSPPSTTSHHLSALPLSRVCQLDHTSVELLFQVFISSNDLLAPLVLPKPAPEGPAEQQIPATLTDVLHAKADSTIRSLPVINTAESVELNRVSATLKHGQQVEGAQQDWAELEIPTRPDASQGVQRAGDPEKEEPLGAGLTTMEADCVCWPHSVQWLDLGQSLVFADLLGQYRSLLWTLCSKALRLQLCAPPAGNSAGSINLHDFHRGFQVLHRMGEASETGLVPEEYKTMLQDFSLYLLVTAAHAHWDDVLCRSLGSALKDKCLTNQDSNFVMPTSKQDGSVMTSVTMDRFLLLPPPLLSSLCCHQLHSRTSGSLSPVPSRVSLRRQTVSLVLASVQLSTVWVMSKAHQFLCSWSLNKFLLITQGDLKMLRESVEMLGHQTRSLMSSDSDHHSTIHNHDQLLLRQQLEALERAVSELQTFCSVVLKTFSSDCKRMSGEIFERTMPSAVHWRPRHRTGFPCSPSEYASLAAQTVIGQVLEGVAPLSDDARVQALSITMTAFMEAWMEHILKQKIKFSVQGALQLKQDFDSIREMIQSDRYGLSAELHRRLLSLRVFQQVDSAVVCLLQQPQAKPYLRSTAWEPFARCCPANSSRDSIDAAVGSNITNLRCDEGEDLNQSDPSLATTDLPPVDPSMPAEPYFAPSLALGAAQQEWLDLRIQSGGRRWRLPGLQCLSKSEP